MAQENPRDIIQAVLRGEMDNPDGLLAILYNHNLGPEDLERVEAFWEGHLNKAWLDQVNAKLKEGFIVFRIQTEFQINGHETHIYMAKMKK